MEIKSFDAWMKETFSKEFIDEAEKEYIKTQITALKARVAELEKGIMRAVKTWGTYPLDIGIRKTMADLRKLVKGE